MKRIALIITSLVFVSVLASCGDKCTTCSYTYDDANGDSQMVTDEEFCGKKSLVKLHQDSFETLAEFEVQSEGGTNLQTSCVDN